MLLKVNILIVRNQQKNTVSMLLKVNISIRRTSPGEYKFYYVPIVLFGACLLRETNNSGCMV